MRHRKIHFYPAHPIVEEMFNDLFENAFGNPKATKKYPLTDVYVKEGIVYMEIAVAGFSKDDISIELIDDALCIKGTKPEEAVDTDKQYIKKDIAKRNFEVAYNTMFPVDSIDAEIVDGILKVVVTPKVKEKEVKQINIK